MDSNILNLLNQGYARLSGYEQGLKSASEKWYKQGLGDSKQHLTKSFKDELEKKH